MKKLLLLSVCMIFSAPSVSLAFSCGMLSVEDAYKASSAVFVGEIIDGTGSTKCGKKKMVFRVDKVFKENPGKQTIVSSGDACMGGGVYLTKGETYLVYASGDNASGYSVWACGRTKNLKWAEKEGEITQLERLLNQRQALDDAIRLQPKNKLPLLRIKAGLLMDQRDFSGAESTLNQVLALDASDTKAYLQLVRSLFEQRKPQEILAAVSKYEAQQQGIQNNSGYQLYVRDVSYALVALGKTDQRRNPILLAEASYNALNLSNLHFSLIAKKSKFTESNFSDSTFDSGTFEESQTTQGDFTDTSFNNATLRDFTFIQDKLYQTDFSGAKLSKASFNRVDFSGAKFVGAELDEVYFSLLDAKDTDFTNAKILNSNLTSTNFEHAKLDGVVLTGSRYNCGTTWPKGFDPIAAGGINDEVCGKDGKPIIKQPDYSESLRSNEFVGKDFSDQEISRQDMTGKNLSGTDFSGTNLLFTSFSYSDLTDANFQWIDQAFEFSNTVLTSTDFSYANLRNASFFGAKFKDTVFAHAVLEGAKFEKADLDGINFKKTNLSGVQIIDSSLKGAMLKGASLRSALVEGSDFSNANLQNALMEGIMLRQPVSCSGFSGDDCTEYAPYESKGIKPKPVRFDDAILRGAKMDLADLRGGIFDKTNLDGVTMVAARYDCTTVWPEGFDPGEHGAVNLDGMCKGKSFSPPQLQNKDFANYPLQRMNLSEANLEGTILIRAQLQKSDLRKAKLKGANLLAASFDCDTIWPDGFNPIAEGAILVPDDRCEQKYGPAQLEGRELHELELFSASLSKANLRKANLSGASLGRADLFKADLSGANLREADMSSANLNGANLKGALYDCNTLWPEGFEPELRGAINHKGECIKKAYREPQYVRALLNNWKSDVVVRGRVVKNEELYWLHAAQQKYYDTTFKKSLLRRANFAGTRLERVKFLDSDLRQAKFEGAWLKDVDFKGSDIRGTDFTGATLENISWQSAVYDATTKGLPFVKEIPNIPLPWQYENKVLFSLPGKIPAPGVGADSPQSEPFDISIVAHDAYAAQYEGKGNRKKDEFARFGWWDSGDCHGEDQWMCGGPGSGYEDCEMDFSQCKSGKAVVKDSYAGDGVCVLTWWKWVCK